MQTNTNEMFRFTDGSALYSTTAKWLVAQPVWEANRVMDVNHVRDLQTSITDIRSIQGPFAVVTLTDELSGQTTNRIVDGQHRQEVIRQFFAANPEQADFSVLCRRYCITSHEQAITIFQQINHAKPMLYKGSPTERLHEIVTALRREFVLEKNGGGAMTAMIRPNCNRPFLDTEYLESALKTYGIPDRLDISVQDVIVCARNANVWYSEDHARLTGRFTQATFDRAKDYQFFLGLDPRCPWLMKLNK